MRKLLIAAIIAATLAAPAMAQLRLDLGIEKPVAIGITGSGGTQTFDDVSSAIRSQWWIMLPTASLYYKFDLGPVNMGAGIRAYTAILAGMAWPNVYGELVLGPVILDAQVGGGLFGYYVLNQGDFSFGKVFVPDLSAWLTVGKKKILRIGGGVMGVYVPDILGSTLPFIGYLGAKAAIDL